MLTDPTVESLAVDSTNCAAALLVSVSPKLTLVESVEASCSLLERLAGDCSNRAIPPGLGGLNWDPASLKSSIARIVSSNTLSARPARLDIFSPKANTSASDNSGN